MLSTDQKGSIAETAIVAAAVRLGIPVFRPFNDGLRYDLVFEVAGRFLRVQCKWASRRGDVAVVNCRSCRRTADGFIRRPYTAHETDAIAAYCLELDRCFFLPMPTFDARTVIHLRLSPSRNNQRLGVNWADDFDFERLDWRVLGP